MTTGIVASISPELRDASSNVDVLATLAREGGGALLEGSEDVFTFEGRAEDAARELFPKLLWAALCLFPVDILVRRLAPAGWRKKKTDEDGAADPGAMPPVVEKPSPTPDDTAGRLLAAKKRLAGRTRRSK
jgi:hypothetical protein